MRTLHFYQASNVDELAWPEQPENLSMGSPALAFFTDFLEVQPLVIESNVSAIDVQRLMQKAHVRLKFVVDKDNRFLGIISADDLIDRKIVQKVSEGEKRNDIGVTELMRPKKALKVLDYKEVCKSTISDVITVLKNSGEQHCLVVDQSSHKVRGVFSASDISRKLHLPIDIQDRSSFYKVFNVAV